MNRALALALLGFASLHVEASSDIAASSLTGWSPKAGGGYERTVGAFSNPVTARVWSAAAGGAVAVAETSSVAAKAGSMVVTATGSVTAANASAAIGRCLVGAVPLCAAAGAAYGAYSVYRMFNPSQVPGSAVPVGQLDFDPGTAPVSTSGRSCTVSYSSYSGTGTGATASAACTAAGSTMVQNALPKKLNHEVGTCNASHQCQTRTIDLNADGSVAFTQPFQTTGTSAVTTSGCPASTDPLDPAYSVPAGSPVGVDGKCPTARYHHTPITPDQAAAYTGANPGTAPGNRWREGLKDAVENGGQTVPSSITSTGPASQTGTPTSTTTSNPGGGTTTTTKTPTYNYTYAGDTFNYTTTVTTTINNGGNVTTTTEQVPNEEQEDPCIGNPNRAGCATLGTAPEAQVIPNSNVPATFSEIAFGQNASCPSGVPMNFSVGGFTNTSAISWQPMCDTMLQVRPIFTALFAAAAALIFMNGITKL